MRLGHLLRTGHLTRVRHLSHVDLRDSSSRVVTVSGVDRNFEQVPRCLIRDEQNSYSVFLYSVSQICANWIGMEPPFYPGPPFCGYTRGAVEYSGSGSYEFASIL